MSGGGHRSKVSMLPLDARIRIYSLIQDGATIKALLADPEVAESLSRTGSTLNGANLTRIRKSREYQEFARQRREKVEALFRDRVETELILRLARWSVQHYLHSGNLPLEASLWLHRTKSFQEFFRTYHSPLYFSEKNM